MKHNKIKVGLVLLLSSLAISQPALAKTTYLNCSSTNSEATSNYDVTLDEDAGSVVYTNTETGQTNKMEGIFTANKVMWGSESKHFATKFIISRVDLSFSLEVLIGGQSVDRGKGTCKIAEAPKRAF